MTVRIDRLFQDLIINSLRLCNEDIEKMMAMAGRSDCMTNHNFEFMLMNTEFKLRDLRKTIEENF